MENQFLSDLCFYCMQSVSRPQNPEFDHAQETFLQLEKKFLQTMGYRFVNKYQMAQLHATAWQEDTAFLEGLRFGVNLMLTVFPYSSSSSRES